MDDERESFIEQLRQTSRLKAPVQSDTASDDSEEEEESEGGKYRAFRGTNRPMESLEIRGPEPDWLTTQYLIRTTPDMDYRRLTLVFSTLMVQIKGCNLRPIAKAISRRRCDYIQLYDAVKWPQAPEPGEPIILSIKCVAFGPPVKEKEELEAA